MQPAATATADAAWAAAAFFHQFSSHRRMLKFSLKNNGQPRNEGERHLYNPGTDSINNSLSCTVRLRESLRERERERKRERVSERKREREGEREGGKKKE